MRLSLNSYNEVPHDDPTVQKFVKTVHLSEGGELTFVPQAHDKEWTTRIIRHKVRHAYHVGKKNYIATVTKVNTYDIAPDDLRPESLKQGGFIVRGNDWKEHYEIEVIFYNIGYIHVRCTPKTVCSKLELSRAHTLRALHVHTAFVQALKANILALW